MSLEIHKLGLIAGNGRFPFLVLEEAVRRNIPVVVAAIKEETSPEIEQCYRPEQGVEVHWLGLGHLGRLLRLFRDSAVDKAIMAGQVKHSRIFSREAPLSVSKIAASLPDLTMLGVLLSLPRKNTEALIGAIAAVLEKNGIKLLDSTCLLEHLLAPAGVLTHRQPTEEEWRNIRYGREIAREIARLDIGQTIVIKDQAVVAVEAMEGTDETIRRAAALAGGRPVTVVKVSRANQDMRFDVPVIGEKSLDVFRECRVSALAIDAGKTLIFDRQEFTAAADRLKMTITAE
ncbi:MAG: LpxI family protein [Acidobacteria bacterium]|nr:MAG: LpxI family protein [Acidobacteriota bacterium]